MAQNEYSVTITTKCYGCGAVGTNRVQSTTLHEIAQASVPAGWRQLYVSGAEPADLCAACAETVTINGRPLPRR